MLPPAKRQSGEQIQEPEEKTPNKKRAESIMIKGFVYESLAKESRQAPQTAQHALWTKPISARRVSITTVVPSYII